MLLWRDFETCWPGGEPFAAACPYLWSDDGFGLRRCESPPTEDHVCGIYGATDLETLGGLTAIPLHPESNIVVGKVALWGRVFQGERGYRAEYAYPRELFVVPETFVGVEAYLKRKPLPYVADPLEAPSVSAVVEWDVRERALHEGVITALEDRYRVPVGCLPAQELPIRQVAAVTLQVHVGVSQLQSALMQAASAFENAMAAARVRAMAKSPTPAAMNTPSPQMKERAKQPLWAAMNQPTARSAFTQRRRRPNGIVRLWHRLRGHR